MAVLSCLRADLALLARLALPALSLWLGACTTPSDPPDRLLAVAGSLELTRGQLLTELRNADVVLLGEQHDNPLHHRRRGALITELGPTTAVVAEQLPRGARVADGSKLLSRLQAAGFDNKAWGWPLFEDLFAPVLGAGLPLLGGNAPRELARQVARDGPSAWPADLRQRLEAAPLTAQAQAALDRALLDGHCGQLPVARLPAMRAAQRVRDASMAQMLLDQHAAGARPVVLVAGNGHVRTDHGVAQLLLAAQPGLKVVSVGFAEPGWMTASAAPTVLRALPYTHLWVTAGVDRGDPCAGFRLPAPAASASRP